MKKSGLLSATSAIALAAVFATPAQAFDFVDWNWNSDVVTDVTSNLNAGAYFYHQGLTQVERLQIKAGDVNASVDLSNTTVDNSAINPPIYITQVNGALVMQEVGYIDPYANIDQTNDATSNVGAPVDQLNASLTMQAGIVNIADVDQSNSATVAGGDVSQVNLAGVIQVGGLNKAYVSQTNTVVVDLDSLADGAALLDARDHLGGVEGAATAIQNVASIESEHATTFHDGQVAFGEFGYGDVPLYIGYGTNSVYEGGECDACDSNSFTGNQMHDLVTLATLGAAFGLIDKGEAKATIKANDVVNASVDISAIAAANIHTVDVTTDYEAGQAGPSAYYQLTDNVVIGDLSQFAYMDVTAKAEAKNLTLAGYSNLGGINAPINKATATALGNVSSIVNKSPGAQ